MSTVYQAYHTPRYTKPIIHPRYTKPIINTRYTEPIIHSRYTKHTKHPRYTKHTIHPRGPSLPSKSWILTPSRSEFHDLGIGNAILVTHVNHTQGEPPPLTWRWMSINLEIREYTTLPTPDPFPSTGSFNFRQGVYNQRSMTVEEQNFEQLVNNRQAEHDISSYLNEWERLKALEEEAIQLWQDLDGNLVEYQRQMRTRDQQAMEYQCQRKKEKTEKLNRPSVCSIVSVQEYINLVARHMALMEGVKRTAMEFAARRASKEVEERRACKEAEKRRSFNEDVQQRAIESALRRVSKEAVKRSATQSAARSTFVKAEKRGATEAAKCKAFVETVKRKLAESETSNTTNTAAATNAQRTSEVRSTTDGIRSDLDMDLESRGESSHSQSPQQSGSADSVSQQPIDNTAQPPRTSPRQAPTLTQSRQNSSISPSPPRYTSVDDSTPPSSQHPSRSESLRSSQPRTPTASRFVPDPAIWGTSIQASSGNQPSQPLYSGRIARIISMRRTLSFMRDQRDQRVPTSNMNGLMLGQQSQHRVPTHWPMDRFVTIIIGDPPGEGSLEGGRRWVVSGLD